MFYLFQTWTVLLLCGLIAGPSPPADTPAGERDPIGDRLEQARTDYVERTEQVRAGLLASLEQKESSARNNGNKQLVDRIKQEREAFELNDELPTVVSNTSYRRGMAQARSRLTAAMRTALKEYLQAREDDRAEAVQTELDEIEAEDAPPPGSGKPEPEPREPFVVGEWAHEVRVNGRVTTRLTYRMYSNGRINSPDGRATWRQRGLVLILRNPSPDAPGGAWVDICRLAPDRRSYLGKNQKGFTIVGVLIGPEKAAKQP